eukprot:g6806.t1
MSCLLRHFRDVSFEFEAAFAGAEPHHSRFPRAAEEAFGRVGGLRYVRALYDYRCAGGSGGGFSAGDVLSISAGPEAGADDAANHDENGWLVGRVVALYSRAAGVAHAVVGAQGQGGIVRFPRAYVAPCTAPHAPPAPQGAAAAVAAAVAVAVTVAVAKYDFEGTDIEDLQFRRGDRIRVLPGRREADDGWWEGECGGRRGVFPAMYVDIVHDTSVE